jgi:beta-barrel assembly-enhancing protease
MQRRTFLQGCACLGIERFVRPEAASDEGGLWAYMDREEDRLRRSSFLVRDPVLHRYVSGIACRLAGEHCPDLRVYIVRMPSFNATMAPNGMMQVWSGLLVRMTNEAQLAAVLGHEIGHYLARHGLERLRDAKSRSAFSQVLGVALNAAGAWAVNPVAQLGMAFGALAYGREHEREADRIGLGLMARAGYAPAEAARVWSGLLEERKRADDEGWSLLATHPPAQERSDALAVAAAGMHGERIGAEAYRAALAPHRTLFLQDEIRRRSFAETMVLLERLQQAAPRDGELRYFMGEACRLKGDFDKALVHYRAAAAMEGAPAELYRSMGLASRRLGGDAAASFRRYLELKPAAPDAELVRSYLL